MEGLIPGENANIMQNIMHYEIKHKINANIMQTLLSANQSARNILVIL